MTEGMTCYERDETLCEDGMCLRTGCRLRNQRLAASIPERLNPLLKVDAIRAADEAACRRDGMFRDLFSEDDRLDLIVTIIRAATTVALGAPSLSTAEPPDA
jgi:hypothetical protein